MAEAGEIVQPVEDSIGSHLELDADAEVQRIAGALLRQVAQVLRRRGAVVGISGGIDSAVCAGLAAKAFGPGRVLGLLMPEAESGPESRALGEEVCRRFGIPFEVEDITGILRESGAYSRRDAAIRRVVPEYGAGWRCKVVLPHDRLTSDRLNVSSLVVEDPTGRRSTHRLPADAYREIVAATNFKQRARKMVEYFHADRMHYAVVGTPNRLEYDQGFFVKGGDGLADVKPIAHLYKTQVYQLARRLGVPDGIIARTPTTDTYSLGQTQEEFYFSISARAMDGLLQAHNEGLAAEVAARRLGYGRETVERVYREIEQKRTTTRYLHEPPLLVEPVRLREA